MGPIKNAWLWFEKNLIPRTVLLAVKTIGFICTINLIWYFNLSHLLLDLAPSVVRRTTSCVSGHVTRKFSSVQRGPSLLLTGVVLKSPLDGPLDSLSRGKQWSFRRMILRKDIFLILRTMILRNDSCFENHSAKRSLFSSGQRVQRAVQGGF